MHSKHDSSNNKRLDSRRESHDGPIAKRQQMSESEPQRVALPLMRDCETDLRNLVLDLKNKPHLTNNTNFIQKTESAFRRLEQCLVYNQEDVKPWAEKEIGRYNPAYKISNLLFNCGTLAHICNKDFAAENLNFLVEHMVNDKAHLHLLHASNAMLGLGKLAKENKIRGMLNTQPIEDLLKLKPSSTNSESQFITNFLYYTGVMAEKGILKEAFNTDALHSHLRTLLTIGGITEQGISINLFGLGIMVQHGKIEAPVEAQEINNCLRKLLTFPDILVCRVHQSLIGIHSLMAFGKLDGKIDVQLINQLLRRLPPRAPSQGKEIAEILDYIGRISKLDKISGSFDVNEINSLLIKLNTYPDLKVIDIINCLYSLACLVKAHKIDNVESLSSELVIATLDLAIKRTVNGRDFTKLIKPLTLFEAPLRVEIRQIRQIFEGVGIKHFLHPTQAAAILSHLVTFKRYHVELSDEFMELIAKFRLPFDKLPLLVQNYLIQDINCLQDVPEWQNALKTVLGLPIEVPEDVDQEQLMDWIAPSEVESRPAQQKTTVTINAAANTGTQTLVSKPKPKLTGNAPPPKNHPS